MWIPEGLNNYQVQAIIILLDMLWYHCISYFVNSSTGTYHHCHHRHHHPHDHIVISILVILWQVGAPLGVLFCNSCHHTPTCVVKMMKKIVMMMINIMMIMIMVGDFLKPPLALQGLYLQKKVHLLQFN